MKEREPNIGAGILGSLLEIFDCPKCSMGYAGGAWCYSDKREEEIRRELERNNEDTKE